MARTLAVGLLAAWLLPGAVRADVLYDTYQYGDMLPSRATGQVPNTGGRDFQYADPFTVSGGDFQLTQLTLRFRHDVGALGHFEILLRDDDAGFPGAVLEQWTLTDLYPTATDVVLPSALHPNLADSARYWVNVRVAGGTGWGSWRATDHMSSEWLYAETGALDPTWLAATSQFGLGLVTVEAPEPAQALLALLGAALLAPFARRRRSATASR
jgi:PEP-CTERM motif